MLTVDVGNSSVGVARHPASEAAAAADEAPPLVVRRAAEPEDAAAFVDGPSVGIAVSRPRWARFVAAVVARGLPEPRRLTGAPLPLADPRLASSAGQDRLAVALALLPGPAVAVDAGTAVTVDLVDAAGVYRGGFIAPGPASALAGLAQRTDALPALRGEPVELGLGGETGQALAAGAWGLAVGGLDRLVEEALGALAVDARRARVVVTGGWGPAWAAVSRHAARLEVDPALVHRGVRAWAAAGGGA